MVKNQFPRKLPEFFWYFMRPYGRYFLWMIVTGVLWAIHTSLIPYMLKLIVDGIAGQVGTLSTVLASIWIPITTFLCSFIMMAGVYRLRDFSLIKILLPIKQDIKYQTFSYIQKHSYHFFQNYSAGTLANKLHELAKGTANIIETSQVFFEHFFALLIASISMYSVRPIFAVALFGWGVSFLGISFIFSKKSHRLSKILSESGTRLTSKTVDSIANIINARIFAREEYEKEYLKQYLHDTANKEEDLLYYMIVVKALQDIGIITLLCCMITLLIWSYTRHLVTVGDFAFILTLSISIFQIIWYLASQFIEFAEQLGICSQSLEMIHIPHEIVDDMSAFPIKILQGGIIFRDVSFDYTPNKPIFSELNITIHPGQKVGLVGFSGSGKTTFLWLILRLFETSTGHISIDDQDIRQVTQESLHTQIAVIPQDPFLFHRTIMENIRYGRLEASDEEIIEVSKKAHCHEFIQQLSEQYHTFVGERGLKLSGGQRQRIAIARAMLKNAPILMMDEATSALDSVTERYIQESLYYLMKDRTTLVVAHRLSTLANMDRIIVFKDGCIIEDGAHGELMAHNDHYAKLWNMQSGGFLPNKPTTPLG